MLQYSRKDVARRFPKWSNERAVLALCVSHWFTLVDSAGFYAVDYAATRLYRDECDDFEHGCKRISMLSSRILPRSGDRFGISDSAAVTLARHWQLLRWLERTLVNPITSKLFPGATFSFSWSRSILKSVVGPKV